MNRIVFALLAASLALPAAAHADPIDDFVLTSASHTYTFSLPAYIANYNPPGYPPPTGPYVSIDSFVEVASGAVDGVSGYQFGIRFYKALSPLRDGFTFSYTDLNGDFNVAGPAVDYQATPYFATGTFQYADYPAYRVNDPNQINDGPYTLTISPETATSLAPEPGTFVLLATGSLGLLSLARKKHLV